MHSGKVRRDALPTNRVNFILIRNHTLFITRYLMEDTAHSMKKNARRKVRDLSVVVVHRLAWEKLLQPLYISQTLWVGIHLADRTEWRS